MGRRHASIHSSALASDLPGPLEDVQYFSRAASTFLVRRSRSRSSASQSSPSINTHTIIIQLFLLMLAEDLLFYFSHRLLHTPFLYRHVHHVHHRTTNTFSLASEYAHPVEIVFSNILPVVLPAYLLRVHLFTYLLWIAVMLVETTIAHCGYHFPLLTPFGVPDDKVSQPR
eukprot:GEZU01027269.1.p2 GENE.GEZU01027269.1~~GEZU01027269.1.p2  ORF type:complete len:171 (+),score=24.25 GEZU01027269.1:371-883(+)